MKKTYDKSFYQSKGFVYLLGALIGMIVTAALIFLFAAIMLFLEVDRSLAAPFATISAALGTASASFFTALKLRDRGYLIGGIMGLIVFFLITIVSLIISQDGLSVNTLFHFIIIMLAGVIGGILGVNHGRTKKYI